MIFKQIYLAHRWDPKQLQPLKIRVDLGVMANKGVHHTHFKRGRKCYQWVYHWEIKLFNLLAGIENCVWFCHNTTSVLILFEHTLYLLPNPNDKIYPALKHMHPNVLYSPVHLSLFSFFFFFFFFAISSEINRK